MIGAGDRPDATCAPGRPCPGAPYSLVFLAFLFHNIDEMIRLPDWLGARGVLLAVPPDQFGRAVLGLTLGVALVMVLGRSLPIVRPVQALVAAVSGALLANAASHVAISLATRSLMPGLPSALTLVLPASLWLLFRLPLPRRIMRLSAFAGAAAMPLVATLALALAA